MVIGVLGRMNSRFYADGKKELEMSWDNYDTKHLETPSPVYKVSAPLLKNEARVRPEGVGVVRPEVLRPVRGRNKITKSLRLGNSKVFPEEHEPWQKRILDPGSEIVLQWNRIFLISCLVALFVDPLYFYLPSVGGSGSSSCLKTDLNLRIVVTCFRTVADLFYLLHMVIKFRTAYIAPSSRVFGKGELVMDPKKIARRYLRSDFFIDLAATLPLPQVLFLICFN